MLNLPTTTAKIIVVTGSAVAAIAVHASFLDLSRTSTQIVPGATNRSIVAATTTTVVNPPPGGFNRNVKFLSINNTSGAPCQVTVQQTNDGVNSVTLLSVDLQPGYALQYSTDADGFRLYDANGRILLTET